MHRSHSALDHQVYRENLNFRTLSAFRAAVMFPYDTSLMLFWEFYSMQMPIFVRASEGEGAEELELLVSGIKV